MRNTRWTQFVSLLAVFIAIQVAVLAQDSEQQKSKMDAFFTVGWSKLWHGDDDHGAGVDVGGRFGVRPFGGRLSGLGVQGTVDRAAVGGGEIDSTGSVLMASADAVWHFGSPRLEGFVSCGIGAMRADYSWTGNTYFGPDPNDPRGRSIETTKVIVPVGVGFKARVTEHLTIRPEFRFVSGSVGSGFNHALVVPSVGIGYSW